MDDKDVLLITELQKDARKSNTELARILNVSEATVRRRIDALLSSGTITLTAVPEPFKLGYKTMAFIGIHVQLSELKSVADKLTSYPEVHYVGICSGSTDIFIWVLFTSPEELSKFITNELASIPGIIRTDTTIQLKSLKRTLGQIQLGKPIAQRLGIDGSVISNRKGNRKVGRRKDSSQTSARRQS